MRTRLLPYGIATLSIVVALLLMLLLDPWLSMSNSPFLLFFGSVIVTALYSGREPGVFATLLSALIAKYFFIEPLYELSLNPINGSRLTIFIVEGIAISCLSGRLRVAQKQTQKSLELLKASEAKFRRLFKSNIIGIVFGDTHGAITEANDAFLQMIGYSREDVLAGRLRWDKMTPPNFHQIDILALEELITKGKNTLYEKEYFHKDGHRVPILVGAALLEDESQENIVSFILDLSQHKQAEAALRQSEERYRYLAESIPQLVWTANSEGALLDVNQRWTEFTGLTLLQAKTAGWEAIVHFEDIPILSQHWAVAQRDGTSYQAEGRMRRVDGVYRWHLHQAVPLKNEHGQVIKWFGTATDIEEQKQFEQQRDRILQQEQAARKEAETANRIKDEFLAVLSHELRSPLNPILGWAKLLQKRKFDETSLNKALSTIERNAQLQAELIEDLLDVSKILQGKLSLNVCPVSLASTIQAAIEIVQLAASAKSIQIQTMLAPNVGKVSGDPSRLQQVIWNLLANAVKFTDVGGRVDIRLEQVASQAQITVSDTGKGIHPDFLPYVFDYFRQADATTTRKFGGLGLGLAIVRNLVELHGGTVQAESQGVGQGATFTIRLPLMLNPQALRNQDTQQAEQSLNLSGVKILVVDDDADTREFMTFLLEQYGASLTVVASASEVFAALTKFQPDILLSDIGMPDMDGYTLIRQLRTLPPEEGGQIPAIALTAYAGEINEKQAQAAGFQMHISKPIEPEELIRAITNLI